MYNEESEHLEYLVEGDFAKGFLWGITLSIPLWVSIFGWIKIFLSLVS